MLSGDFVLIGSHPCSSTPVGQTWFNLTVHVQGHGVNVSVDNSLTLSYSSYYNGGDVGAIVANGYGNIIRMKDFTVIGDWARCPLNALVDYSNLNRKCNS